MQHPNYSGQSTNTIEMDLRIGNKNYWNDVNSPLNNINIIIDNPEKFDEIFRDLTNIFGIETPEDIRKFDTAFDEVFNETFGNPPRDMADRNEHINAIRTSLTQSTPPTDPLTRELIVRIYARYVRKDGKVLGESFLRVSAENAAKAAPENRYQIAVIYDNKLSKRYPPTDAQLDVSKCAFLHVDRQNKYSSYDRRSHLFPSKHPSVVPDMVIPNLNSAKKISATRTPDLWLLSLADQYRLINEEEGNGILPTTPNKIREKASEYMLEHSAELAANERIFSLIKNAIANDGKPVDIKDITAARVTEALDRIEAGTHSDEDKKLIVEYRAMRLAQDEVGVDRDLFAVMNEKYPGCSIAIIGDVANQPGSFQIDESFGSFAERQTVAYIYYSPNTIPRSGINIKSFSRNNEALNFLKANDMKLKILDFCTKINNARNDFFDYQTANRIAASKRAVKDLRLYHPVVFEVVLDKINETRWFYQKKLDVTTFLADENNYLMLLEPKYANILTAQEIEQEFEL